MPLETNIDDLTDAGVLEVLFALVPSIDEPLGRAGPRCVLGEVVAALDRASPDWPQSVLGLPAVA